MDYSAIFKFSSRIWQVLQLIAVMWNMLLLVVLCQLKSPRRSYFILVKSLTVADLLLPLCFFMFDLIFQSDLIILQADMIDIMLMVNRYLVCVIFIHLICLAAEHFVAIMKPLCYEEWCHCHYIICRLVLIWTFPFLFIILQKTLTIGIYLFILPGLIVLCFLIMLVMYIFIFFEVRKQQRFENSQNNHAEKNYRALVITILIVATFFFCWVPSAVILVLKAVGVDKFKNPYIFFFFEIGYNINCVNSIFDALIYSIRLTEVKTLWRKTFCCVGPCSRSSDNQ